MGEDSSFEARCEARDGGAVVVARGELDLRSAEELRELLHQPEAHAPTVILDLRGVTFIDSSGLSVIVGENRRAITEQFRFAVAVGGARAVQRLFELSGLVGTLAIVDDPESVLRS
jgi:anti-anti-sigma factor